MSKNNDYNAQKKALKARMEKFGRSFCDLMGALGGMIKLLVLMIGDKFKALGRTIAGAVKHAAGKIKEKTKPAASKSKKKAKPAVKKEKGPSKAAAEKPKKTEKSAAGKATKKASALEETSEKKNAKLKFASTSGPWYKSGPFLGIIGIAVLVIAIIVIIIVTSVSAGKKGAIKQKQIEENGIEVPFSSEEMIGDNVDYIRAKLTDAGFRRFKMVEKAGKNRENGEIKEISIDGDKDFDEGDKFARTAQIVITYYIDE